MRDSANAELRPVESQHGCERTVHRRTMAIITSAEPKRGFFSDDVYAYQLGACHFLGCVLDCINRHGLKLASKTMKRQLIYL